MTSTIIQETVKRKSDEREASSDDVDHDRQDKEVISHKKRNLSNLDYIIPHSGQNYLELLTSDLDREFLKEGEATIGAMKSSPFLSSNLYKLVKEDRMTVEHIQACTTLDEPQSNTRLVYLKARYYVDSKLNVHDRSRRNKIVVNPKHRFRLIMSTHLLNKHISSEKVFNILNGLYSNFTRDLTLKVTRYCTRCNPSRELHGSKKSVNLVSPGNTFSYERLVIDIMEPFENEKIEKKYSHLLLIQDYRSKFVWTFPLKNLKLKTIISKVTTFIVSLPVAPIYISSMTVSFEDIRELCFYLLQTYNVLIGVGNGQEWRKYTGYPKIPHLLTKNKEECINSFLMCMKHISEQFNNTENKHYKALKCDGLFEGHSDFLKLFYEHKNGILGDLSLEKILKLDEQSDLSIYVEQSIMPNAVKPIKGTRKSSKFLSEEIINSDIDDEYDVIYENEEYSNMDDTNLDYDDTFIDADTSTLDG